MKSAEIRQSFVDFFAERGHRIEPSAPLVPHGDPTLLFTNAGMVQFKEYFLGTDEPPSPRAVSVQKCLRVSGKHNDLENVGPSPRHHTFFEMLGNFSFGDYFKEEAIRLAWELVTGPWGLAPERLFATVFEEDEEAAELWGRLTPLPAGRILRCGAKDNFWAMGETGPCGPCSEIFVDLEPDRPAVDFQEGSESGRYLEIWNLVFMQFERGGDGETTPLPDPSIDTGAGLERVAAVLQGVDSNYDSDLFRPLLAAAARAAGTSYGAGAEGDTSLRVIADHVRSVAFLLADGVIPGNEGRGYVLRRLLRRAVRHGMSLGLEEPFLADLLPEVRRVMGGHYRELAGAETASMATVRTEEEKFLSTVATASRQVQAAIGEARRDERSRLDGEAVFRFYDTYGLPLEVIREIAEEERFEIDEEGFRRALDEQRRRSREAADEGGGWQAAAAALQRADRELPRTRFVGYGELAVPVARVLALVRLAGDEAEVVPRLEQGEAGVAVFDETPFYAESGGQVGDRGRLEGEDGLRVAVEDTRKDGAGVHYHVVRVEAGELERGDRVAARVDAALRRSTERHHTATHLLHAALRRVLGEGVRQAGSLVASDRLRFDFTHGRPVTDGELARVEELVARWILAAEPTEIVEGRDFEEAVEAGAMALFGEKYGERVRTVEVPPVELPGEEEPLRSLELCGGCHVANIGEIGPFLVVGERGIASGVRRIEAVTGEAALDWIRRRRELLHEVETEIGGPAEEAPREIVALRRRLREMEKELSALRMKLVSGAAADGGGDEIEVAGVKVLAREVPPAPANELRNMADVLRSRLGSGVVVLGTRDDGKASLVTAITSDLTDRLHAGRLAKRLGGLVGGRGGGRDDFAQAGGKDAEKLPEALAAVAGVVEEELAGG